MSSSARVIVLGIDAASPDLLDRWVADGTLPVLRSIVENGLHARIRGLDGFFVGATWPSLYTGTGPGRHGVHYLFQVPPGCTAYSRVADGSFVRGEPFWTALAAAGNRVAVLDVPLSRISAGLNGVQTVEWGSHDALYGFHAWPPTLEQTIHAEYGEHPLGPSCDGVRRSVSEIDDLTTRLVAGARTKGRLTRHVLGSGRWDFLMQVFTEAHCAGHQLWHVHDPTHPGHDAALAAEMGDPLRRVYRAVDDAIGVVLEDARDAVVVVVAAHGMSHAYGAQFLLPEILFRLGAAEPPPRVGRSAGVRAMRSMLRLMPDRLRRQAFAVRARLASNQGLPSIGADVTRSKCFPIANGLTTGGIRLNLAGREPSGVLRPQEARRFVRELELSLLSLVDERSGEPAVRRVSWVSDLHSGDLLPNLPDLLVEWNDTGPIGSVNIGTGSGAVVRLSSPVLGTIEGCNTWSRSGEHRRDGLIIVSGPGVGSGPSPEAVGLLDLAPTFCDWFGIRLANADGAPVPALALCPALSQAR